MPRGYQVRATSVTIFAHLLFVAITTLVLVWLLHFREGVALNSSNKIKIFNVSRCSRASHLIMSGTEIHLTSN